MHYARSFPSTRLRRLRRSEFSRQLTVEHRLSVKDLILPLFVCEGKGQAQDVASMPGVQRQSSDLLLKTIEQAVALGLPAVVLFPIIDGALKTQNGAAALDPRGLIPKVIATIKKEFPQLGVITDIALDPYTSHGQDGVVDRDGYVLNDKTVETLAHQALVHADAGADIVAPSDMMDGRIRAVREALEERGYANTLILAYAAKYASHFYGPFRDAVGSGKSLGKGDKRTYQMAPGNSDEAMHEIALDLQEGADMIMVKPGLPYLDIIHRAKTEFGVPTFAYNVSGEYAMIKAAAAQGWIEERPCVLEALTSFKRAGASGILTYHALDAARWLSQERDTP